MRPSICLNMIVKNEAPIIKRCLKSIKPWIDTWLITDTGSNDGTQEIIRDFMKDMPGELIEVPWVNFSHNRNIALDLARSKADYSLFIDADQQFIPVDGIESIYLTKDCYTIHLKENLGSSTYVYFLVRNQARILWKGVIHEYISGPTGFEHVDGALFKGGYIFSTTKDGNRSKDPNKYLKDAYVLERALIDDPNNARYMFYLGQSYANCNKHLLALKSFEKRARMGGEDEEVFFSLYMIGSLQESLEFDEETCLQSFIKAHQYIPSRQEPVYRMGQIYIKRNEFKKSYNLLVNYVFHYNLNDQFLVQSNISDYLLPIAFSHTCYCLGKYKESYEVLTRISTLKNLPEKLKVELDQGIEYIRKLQY